MQHRSTILLILILVAGVLLTACEEDDSTTIRRDPETPAEIAETVLDAINDQDLETAEQYLCEQDIATLQENPPGDAYPQFSRVDCAGNETIVTCRYTIEINGSSAETGVEAFFDVIEDGRKICAATE